MADLFTSGIDQMRLWTTGDYRLLLVDSTYVFAATDDFVSAVAGSELAGAGYSRQAAGTKTRTVDDGLVRITYDCADPDFGSIVAGETADAMVLFLQVTNDADSILIAHYDLGGIPTTGSPFVITVDAAGLVYADQGA